MEYNSIWNEIMKLYEINDGSRGFAMANFLFSESKVLSLEDNIFTLIVDDFVYPQFKNTSGDTFLTLLKYVHIVLGKDTNLNIVTEDMIRPINSIPKEPPTSIKLPAFEKSIDKEPPIDSLKPYLYEDTNLNFSQTFSNFFYSHESIEIINSCSLLVESIRDAKLPAFNPLFLHGESGIGKTHIINALGNELYKDNPNLRILYRTAPDFAKDYSDIYVGGLDSTKKDRYKQKYMNLDVLIVDDIQMLQTNETTLGEFFNFFEYLSQNHKLIVITSDVHPKHLKIPPRLTTRFISGVEIKMVSPDSHTKRQIFDHIIETKDIDVTFDEDAKSVFVENSNSVRELLGYVNKLMVKCISTDYSGNFTETDALSLIDTVEVSPNMLKTDDIINEVANYYDLTKADLLSKSRKRNIILARKITIILLKERMNLTHAKIALVLGYKDHTNVSKVCKTSELIKKENSEAYGHISRHLNMLKK